MYHPAVCPVFARVLYLSTTDIWGWIFRLVLRGCPVHCRKLGSISSLHPVETSSNCLYHQLRQCKMSPDIVKCSLGGRAKSLPVAKHWLWEKRLFFVFDWHTDSAGINSFKRIIMILTLLNAHCKAFYLLLYRLCLNWSSQHLISSISHIRKMRFMESKRFSRCHKTSKRWTQGSNPCASGWKFTPLQLRFNYFFINESTHAIFSEPLGVGDAALTVTTTTLMPSSVPGRKVWLKIYFLHQKKRNQAAVSLGGIL